MAPCGHVHVQACGGPCARASSDAPHCQRQRRRSADTGANHQARKPPTLETCSRNGPKEAASRSFTRQMPAPTLPAAAARLPLVIFVATQQQCVGAGTLELPRLARLTTRRVVEKSTMTAEAAGWAP